MPKVKQQKNSPAISVIVPVYNTDQSYLIECFDSIKQQTFKDFEVIIVDDGSKSTIAQFIDTYTKDLKTWRAMHQKNKGGNTARNLGFQESKGKYIVWLDSDDVFDPALLQKAYDAISQRHADIALWRLKIMGESTGRPSSYLETLPGNVSNKGVFNWRDVPDSFFQIISWSAETKIFSKEFLLDKHLLWDPELQSSQDMDFCGRAMLVADRVSFIDDILVQYRVGTAHQISAVRKTPLSSYVVAKKLQNVVKKVDDSHLLKQSFANKMADDIFYYLRDSDPEFKESYNEVRQFLLELNPRNADNVAVNRMLSCIDYEEYRKKYLLTEISLQADQLNTTNKQLQEEADRHRGVKESARQPDITVKRRGVAIMVQNNKKIDISVNITAHKEGLLLYKTLRSIDAGIKFALEKNINIEVNLSLDNADELTRRIAKDFIKNLDYKVNIFEITNGDLGLSRNYLIDKSSGKYIVFFDGDDFFTENFLYNAFELAEKSDTPAIYSARHIVCFEADNYVTKVLDSKDKRISKQYFFETNYYISQNFVHRKIYESIRYEENSDTYGYEDWHFNCEVLGRGYEFITIPDTIFFYRRKKSGSLLAQHINRTILRSSELFKPEVFTKLRPKWIDDKSATEVDVSVENYGKKLKQLVGRYPLVYNYLKTTRDLNVGALRDVKEIFNRRVLGRQYVHNVDQSQEQSIQDRVKAYSQKPPTRLTDFGLTKEGLTYWTKLNNFEPMIRTSWNVLESIPLADYPMSSTMSDAYFKLCSLWLKSDGYTDLVLIPHVVRGGAELETIRLVEDLSKKGRRVMVISTLDSESVWSYKIDKIENAVFVDGRDLFEQIPDQDRRQLLLVKLIQNCGMKSLTIVNSELGYNLVIRYKNVLKDVGCKVFVLTFAFDVTEEGYIYNYIQNGLVDMYDAVTKYVTDSVSYKDQLIEVNGFEGDKIVPLYMPINPDVVAKSSFKKAKKILYAGRICNQKIADVAVEVGAELAKHGIELHFYGNIDPEYDVGDKFKKMIEPHTTIRYMGIYEGFESLPINDYDMFLLTTRTEGMANVILEACKANIYIVSAAVGGLPECVKNGKNGFLVKDEDKFDYMSYVNAIMDSYKRGLFSDQKTIDTENNKIRKRHSESNHEKTLVSLYDGISKG